MEQEVRERVQAAAIGRVQLRNLDCHETVCRMYLQFEDQLDASAYMAGQHPADRRYAYQSLDPRFDGAGFDASNSMFEVLVKRERPEALPRHDAPPAQEDEVVVTVQESVSVTTL